jgi:hypothetical protein
MPKGRNHLEDLGIDGKIILEQILMEIGGVTIAQSA